MKNERCDHVPPSAFPYLSSPSLIFSFDPTHQVLGSLLGMNVLEPGNSLCPLHF